MNDSRVEIATLSGGQFLIIYFVECNFVLLSHNFFSPKPVMSQQPDCVTDIDFEHTNSTTIKVLWHVKDYFLPSLSMVGDYNEECK